MKKTYPSIPGLEPDAWSNDACRGYVIYGNAGLWLLP